MVVTNGDTMNIKRGYRDSSLPGFGVSPNNHHGWVVGPQMLDLSRREDVDFGSSPE